MSPSADKTTHHQKDRFLSIRPVAAHSVRGYFCERDAKGETSEKRETKCHMIYGMDGSEGKIPMVTTVSFLVNKLGHVKVTTAMHVQ